MRSLLTLAATLLALTLLSCGVEFEPEQFCFKCVDASDCGDGYRCEPGDGAGRVGWCQPVDPAEAAKSACN